MQVHTGERSARGKRKGPGIERRVMSRTHARDFTRCRIPVFSRDSDASQPLHCPPWPRYVTSRHARLDGAGSGCSHNG